MGKISSYPSDANVTTSDRLIGSDNENSNETKNFEIGDIINLAASIIIPPGGFVPYTGATANVDLGAFGLTTSYLTSSLGMFIDGANGAISLDGDEGLTGEFLVSQGPGATPSWTNPSSVFVPYTGATADVFLGTNEIYAAASYFPNIYATNIFPTISTSLIFVGGGTNTGLLINTSTNIFRLGDYNGNFNATNISIEDGLSRITFVGGFNLSNGQGTAGQVLTSAGAGTTPVWASIPSPSGFVPYTGATTGVNLGIFSMAAANVNSNNFVPVIGGSGNVFFGGAGGYNVAKNGVYALGTDVTILGNSSSSGNGVKIEIDDTNELIVIGNSASANIEIDSSSSNQIIINNTTFDIGGISSLELANGEGDVGQVLISQGFSAPQWSYMQDVIELPFLSAYSDLTQIANAANVGQAMIFNPPFDNFDIFLTFDGSGNITRILFGDSGMYNIQFSTHIRRTTGGGPSTVNIWFRKGGLDIPNSNRSVDVQNNAGHVVESWNFFHKIDITQPDPFIEIMWATTNVNTYFETSAATAVHPATPSVILTVNKVSNII